MRPYLTALVSALVLAQATIQPYDALAGQAEEANTKSEKNQVPYMKKNLPI